MKIVDNDLLSIQEARILAENSREAQKELLKLTNEKIDEVIEKFLDKVVDWADKYLNLICEETRIGNVDDEKLLLNMFLPKLKEKLHEIKCVGNIKEDEKKRMIEVGVPYGVIAAFCSEKNSLLTLIYYISIALKSKNTIILACNKKNSRVLSEFLDKARKFLELEGVPECSISYLSNVSLNGYKEIINHKDVNLILNTEVFELSDEIEKSGKILLCGTYGNIPVFIERSANIDKAVGNIVSSKSLNYGVAPGSEQAIVVERKIVDEVKEKFKENNCYIMNKEESDRLKEILFDKYGDFNKKYQGKSAQFLAKDAGITIDKNIKLLITSEKYLTLDHVYAKEKLCPVLDFYVEDDWENACEKCIELLLNGNQGHTLILHSTDEKVIEQFCLRKPVGRLLVNTSGVLGSMGITSDFFPAVTLGSGVTGQGITSDNISPKNLVYIRKIGYEKAINTSNSNYKKILDKKIEGNINNKVKNNEIEEQLKKLLMEILK